MNIVPKEWGREIWIVNCPRYCGKYLEIDEGARSSLHQHKEKQETFYCMKGVVQLTIDNVIFIIGEGDEPITIKPNSYHSFEALQDSVLLEISTQHKEEDVFRISKSQPAVHHSRNRDKP